jgi:hypothetical protein
MVFFSRGRVFEPEGAAGEGAAGEGGETQGEGEPVEVGGPAWGEDIRPVVTYPEGPLLLSGWMTGDERIRGKAAALDVSFGGGKIFIFGFNVHNRGQARSTLKLLLNALLYE